MLIVMLRSTESPKIKLFELRKVKLLLEDLYINDMLFC